MINNLKENVSCAHMHAAVQAVAWILQLTGASLSTSNLGFVFLVTFTLSLTHYMMMLVITNGNQRNFCFLGAALSLTVAIIWVLNFDTTANAADDIVECVFLFLSFTFYAAAWIKKSFFE